MKKTIVIAAVTMLAAQAAEARIVRSRTFGERAKTPTEWIIRIGVGANNAAGSGTKAWTEDHSYGNNASASLGSRAGFDFAVGFNKPIKSSGLYWGMEFGIGTRGASGKTERHWTSYQEEKYENSTQSFLSWNMKYSPLTIGYKYQLNDDIRLDAHLGLFASYDFAGGGKVKWKYSDEEDYEDTEGIHDDYLEGFQPFDCGLRVGAGVWWRNLNFDITYQRGFIKAFDSDELASMLEAKKADVYSSNVTFSVGISF